MTTDRTAYVDWPRLLGDIAYLLGEPEFEGSASRRPLSEVRLAAALGFSRGKLQNVLNGTRVEYHDGCMLILRWASLSGKPKEFVPITVRVMSSTAVEVVHRAKVKMDTSGLEDLTRSMVSNLQVTPEQVADILASKESGAVLAARLNISAGMVSAVRRRKTKLANDVVP